MYEAVIKNKETGEVVGAIEGSYIFGGVIPRTGNDYNDLLLVGSGTDKVTVINEMIDSVYKLIGDVIGKDSFIKVIAGITLEEKAKAFSKKLIIGGEE